VLTLFWWRMRRLLAVKKLFLSYYWNHHNILFFWDKTWHYGSFGRVVRCRWPFFSSPPLENNIGHSVLLLISNCCYWSFYKFSIYFQFHHSILICDIFFFQFYHSIPIDFSFQFHPSIKNLLLFFISILISILLIVFFC